MAAKKERLVLGQNSRKCQPRLRMIANASPVVNAVRAEQCASIAVEAPRLLKQIPLQRGEEGVPVKKSQLPRSVKRGSLKEVPSNVYANVFIETLDMAESNSKTKFPGERARKSNLVTAQLPLSKIKDILARDNVTYIHLGEPLAAPRPEVSPKKVGAPPPSLRRFGTAQQRKKAENVLVGIIDVQGFDFSHEDFLDANGKTRFVRIWDQAGTTRPSPKGSKQFAYGSEILGEHLNAALAAAPRLKIPAYELEPQSQMEVGSHGTHVASIAAGNRGVCPNAMLAAVLISVPKADQDRRKSFYDSTRVADAVDYLIHLAGELTTDPKNPVRLSINISLGTNGHAHDGSSAISRWIDSAMSVPGRCVSVAAGNAGQEVAAFEGDSGFVMGRIHTSGHIPARDLVKDIEWLVVGNGIADISENELEIWYSPQDRFDVMLRPPNSEQWIGPIAPRQFIENRQLKDGSFVSIYNELYHPANGANYISIIFHRCSPGRELSACRPVGGRFAYMDGRCATAAIMAGSNAMTRGLRDGWARARCGVFLRSFLKIQMWTTRRSAPWPVEGMCCLLRIWTRLWSESTLRAARGRRAMIGTSQIRPRLERILLQPKALPGRMIPGYPCLGQVWQAPLSQGLQRSCWASSQS